MIICKLEGILDTERDVKTENWNSRRLLLKRDGMGYSVHDTLIHAGTETKIHYKNHLEACYCIEGEGEIESLENGEVHALKPGTIYALDKHDPHLLRAKSEMRLICVFNPPVVGREVHDENGVYPLLEED
ncbi:MAG: L-ectoine synthase [Candidatus Altiarchaeales archaeon WOR_SM1_79]|nr:MAG: L-ectoine synthase [Candidatus Altiarchaeales archaeon WOR_SM1_79]